MALTVRPDDEVYQFDTVWLGPDEYTLPIQARYVAWGTWLSCFLVAAVILIPLGGDGPAGVLGSLIWSLGLSIVLSRAVMLVVDHERPLRSLPALFSAEARAAVQARRRAERALLVRPGKIRVRETPPKVVARRERQRSRAASRAERKGGPMVADPPVEQQEPQSAPDLPVTDWSGYSQPEPAWSIPTGGYDAEDSARPAPRTYGGTYPAGPQLILPELAGSAPGQPAVPVLAAAVRRPGQFRGDPPRPDGEPDRTGRQVEPDRAERAPASRADRATPDGQAAIEARIVLPARKDR